MSIGHNVVIHGAKIHDYALIGMGAVVMDDAEVGEGALVAAGSVVLSRTKIGAHELWVNGSCQVRQDGRAGEGQGDERQDSPQLSDVLQMVRRHTGMTARVRGVVGGFQTASESDADK